LGPPGEKKGGSTPMCRKEEFLGVLYSISGERSKLYPQFPKGEGGWANL